MGGCCCGWLFMPKRKLPNVQSLPVSTIALPGAAIQKYNALTVNGSHHSEEELPRFPFFGTSDKRGKVNRNSRDDNPKTTGRENKGQVRGAIIQQLKELKELKDSDILTEEQFLQQKEKLIKELEEL
ncbi:hypothetical protein OS493_006753 [Desmophyllum pertusum]|uniref:SHOCT domain-containing protein n=1 Tax=Desmophyllum pertusum TaxID=174260 RepID=A0A9W9ZSM0_9CNID|nr:hypothetical protein OS493_006753 [Desmophyllum pertusum]